MAINAGTDINVVTKSQSRKKEHNMELTTEQIKLLAQAEKDMDAGILPYIVSPDGGRASIDNEVLKELGLTRGQRITDAELFRQIMIKSCMYGLSKCKGDIGEQDVDSRDNILMMEDFKRKV